MDFLDLSMVKQITLLFFFLFFAGVVFWAFFSRRARQFKAESRLPLEEGQLAQSMNSQKEERSHV